MDLNVFWTKSSTGQTTVLNQDLSINRTFNNDYAYFAGRVYDDGSKYYVHRRTGPGTTGYLYRMPRSEPIVSATEEWIGSFCSFGAHLDSTYFFVIGQQNATSNYRIRRYLKSDGSYIEATHPGTHLYSNLCGDLTRVYGTAPSGGAERSITSFLKSDLSVVNSVNWSAPDNPATLAADMNYLYVSADTTDPRIISIVNKDTLLELDTVFLSELPDDGYSGYMDFLLHSYGFLYGTWVKWDSGFLEHYYPFRVRIGDWTIVDIYNDTGVYGTFTIYPEIPQSKRLNIIYNNSFTFYNVDDYPEYGTYPFWVIGDTLYGAGYWTPGSSNYISAASGQAYQDRSPTSDDAESGTWAGASPGTRWTIADNFTWVDPPKDQLDPPSTYLTHGTTAGYLTFGFSSFNVPSGRDIYALILFFRSRGAAGGVRYFYGRLKVGGSYYNDTWSINPPSTWFSYVRAIRVNPRTNARWTVDDVNGVGSNPLQAFGIYSTDANPTIDIGAVALRVVYEDPSSVLADGTSWIELDWHEEYYSAFPNGWPVQGDFAQENLFTEPAGTFAPADETERSFWIYPSPSARIWHDTPSSSETIQVGDIIYHEGVWQNVNSIITEIGDGWFKSAPYTGGGLINVPSAYQPYQFIRGAVWYYVNLLPWEVAVGYDKTSGYVLT
jgi:hypothetical protein